jgi:hypothetical protein
MRLASTAPTGLIAPTFGIVLGTEWVQSNRTDRFGDLRAWQDSNAHSFDRTDRFDCPHLRSRVQT